MLIDVTISIQGERLWSKLSYTDFPGFPQRGTFGYRRRIRDDGIYILYASPITFIEVPRSEKSCYRRQSRLVRTMSVRWHR